MNIDLHIEELILLGFVPGDRGRIAEAIQNELTRLLSGNDLPQTFEKDREIPRLDGGSFVLRTGERPESIGTRIGQAVYQGIAGNQSKESRS
jgi:hypothetical protein